MRRLALILVAVLILGGCGGADGGNSGESATTGGPTGGSTTATSAALAAAAPDELRGDYQVLQNAWRHERDATEQAGWSPHAFRQAVAADLGNTTSHHTAGLLGAHTWFLGSQGG